MIQAFGINLLLWYDNNQRDLPWNHTKDPYKIWISEIILQQTRVEQGLPYYLKFIARFPTLESLANADEVEVLKYWQGLGYYSRARNLHFSAQDIFHNLDGQFPSDYKSILGLKGIGKYTAAAIASFAYDLPYPVIDGNVQRVISRYFTIDSDTSYQSYLKDIESKTTEVFVAKNAADFNRAIMNLGALICKPKKPECKLCPLKADCFSNKKMTQSLYPPKKPKVNVECRYFHYLDITTADQKQIIHQRLQKDIWAKLFQFALLESDHHSILSQTQIKKKLSEIFVSEVKYQLIDQFSENQRLTHRKIYARFYKINILKNEKVDVLPPYSLVSTNLIKDFALPKIIINYLNSLSIIEK